MGSLDRTATAARQTSLGAGNRTNPSRFNSIRHAAEVRQLRGQHETNGMTQATLAAELADGEVA